MERRKTFSEPKIELSVLAYTTRDNDSSDFESILNVSSIGITWQKEYFWISVDYSSENISDASILLCCINCKTDVIGQFYFSLMIEGQVRVKSTYRNEKSWLVRRTCFNFDFSSLNLPSAVTWISDSSSLGYVLSRLWRKAKWTWMYSDRI